MKETKTRRIVSLEAENVKRIVAVHIEPGDANCVLVGGDNEAGKTSVLDSIMYALGGANVIAEEPLRRGEEKGFVRLDLGDLIVERRFLKSGTSSLKVMTADGASYNSPQKILDALFCRLSFDPFKFATMKPDEQAATLRDLVGVDLGDLNAEYSETYEERTLANREVKAAQATAEAIIVPDDAPEVRPNLEDLHAQVGAALKAEELRLKYERDAGELDLAIVAETATIENTLAKLSTVDTEWNAAKEAADKSHATRIEALKARHAAEVEELRMRHEREMAAEVGWGTETSAKIERERERQKADLANTKMVAEESRQGLRERLERLEKPEPWTGESVEELRRKIGEGAKLLESFEVAERKRRAGERVEELKAKAKTLTDKLDEIDAKKLARISGAKYPIEGLAFSTDGAVTLDGLPFSQASTAKRIRTSVAMGLAMNPTLRVLLIRDGSLLDDRALAMVQEMAAAADAQVWIERVGDRDQNAIIIEDGQVREQEAAEIQAAANSVAQTAASEPAAADEHPAAEEPATAKRSKKKK